MRMFRAAAAAGAFLLVLAAYPAVSQAAISAAATSQGQTANAGASTLTLNKPGGVVAGQVAIAAIALTGTATVTPPSGWTQIDSTPSGSAMTLVTFWHITTSSETNSVFTFSSSTQAAGGVIYYSGVDTTTIVDALGGQTASGTTATAPSVSATYPGDLVLGVGAFDNQGGLTAASGTTKRITAHVGVTNGPTMLGEDVTQAAAGPTAGQTITDNTSASAAIGEVIALKAASATGTLSVSTAASPSFSANLDGGDATPTYTLPTTVTASVLPAPGWNATLTSTTFSTGTTSLSTSASTISSAPTIACVSSQANCTSATNSVSYPVSVPAGAAAPSAVKIYNAASGTGAGIFTLTPTIAVSVPQNSYAGTYSSNLTLAIVSGP